PSAPGAQPDPSLRRLSPPRPRRLHRFLRRPQARLRLPRSRLHARRPANRRLLAHSAHRSGRLSLPPGPQIDMRLAPLLLALPLLAQQTKQRDLKIEKVEDTVPAAPGFSIPRSFAVIAGISRYKNLPANLQLQYAERDAQSIYTILISPEGGN